MKKEVIVGRKRTNHRHGNKKQYCIHVFTQQTLSGPYYKYKYGMVSAREGLGIGERGRHWVLEAV